MTQNNITQPANTVTVDSLSPWHRDYLKENFKNPDIIIKRVVNFTNDKKDHMSAYYIVSVVGRHTDAPDEVIAKHLATGNELFLYGEARDTFIWHLQREIDNWIGSLEDGDTTEDLPYEPTPPVVAGCLEGREFSADDYHWD